MRVMFFGQFLLDRGVINERQLQQALAYQNTVNIRVGTLAIDQGLMNHTQVQEIMELQKRRNQLFGELAIAQNYLTREQLEDLLKQQSDNRVYLGEVLLELHFITLEELERNLKEYQQAEQLAAEDAEESLRKAPSGVHIKTMLSVILDFFRRMTDLSGKMGVCQRTHIDRSLVCLAVRQKMEGDLTGYLILSFSKRVVCHIATKLTDISVDDMDDMAVDAVMEFVSITTGHICAALGSQGVRVKASSPESFDLSTEEGWADRDLIPLTLTAVPIVFPEETIEMAFVGVQGG